MKLENIDSIHCEADCYSPLYANQLDTHAIIAKGKIKNDKKIITKLVFNEKVSCIHSTTTLPASLY